jgi:hypothetical protein
METGTKSDMMGRIIKAPGRDYRGSPACGSKGDGVKGR